MDKLWENATNQKRWQSRDSWYHFSKLLVLWLDKSRQRGPVNPGDQHMWWERSVPIVYTRLVELWRSQTVWDGDFYPRGFDSLHILNAKIITDHLWSTITAIFPCVALSCQDCSLPLIFVYYFQPKKEKRGGKKQEISYFVSQPIFCNKNWHNLGSLPCPQLISFSLVFRKDFSLDDPSIVPQNIENYRLACCTDNRPGRRTRRSLKRKEAESE